MSNIGAVTLSHRYSAGWLKTGSSWWLLVKSMYLDRIFSSPYIMLDRISLVLFIALVLRFHLIWWKNLLLNKNRIFFLVDLWMLVIFDLCTHGKKAGHFYHLPVFQQKQNNFQGRNLLLVSGRVHSWKLTWTPEKWWFVDVIPFPTGLFLVPQLIQSIPNLPVEKQNIHQICIYTR